MQASHWEACICVYFSVHISILGHVRLISKTVCSRDPESAPLSCFHFETRIPGYRKQKWNKYIYRRENNTTSVWDHWDFRVNLIQCPCPDCNYSDVTNLGKLIRRLISREELRVIQTICVNYNTRAEGDELMEEHVFLLTRFNLWNGYVLYAGAFSHRPFFPSCWSGCRHAAEFASTKEERMKVPPGH